MVADSQRPGCILRSAQAGSSGIRANKLAPPKIVIRSRRFMQPPRNFRTPWTPSGVLGRLITYKRCVRAPIPRTRPLSYSSTHGVRAARRLLEAVWCGLRGPAGCGAARPGEPATRAGRPLFRTTFRLTAVFRSAGLSAMSLLSRAVTTGARPLRPRSAATAGSRSRRLPR